MPAFVYTLAFKLIAAGVVVLILLVSVKSCTGARERAAQSQQDARGAKASAETAKDAAATVIANAERNATTDELVAETVKEMDNVEDPKQSAALARIAICQLLHDTCEPATK